MAPKLFITGATGYVGGTVFNTLVTNHPEYEITVLLRNTPAGFSEKYPDVKILKGSFDDYDLLKQAASRADIVLHHGNSDYVPAVQALVAGVVARAEASLPAYYIHLGGTAIIMDMNGLGELASKVWSDVDDVDAIWRLPVETMHRATESLIQAAWTQHGDRLKTAVVSPPSINGKGTGPGNTTSISVPAFYAESVKAGAPFYVGSGSNVQSHVSVQDVAQVSLKLVEAAAAGGGGADWNRDGYYFVPSEEISQLEYARATGAILRARGLLPTDEPEQITLEELDKKVAEIPVPGVARLMFASNSRANAVRAEKVLGIKAKSPEFLKNLESDLLIAAGLEK